MTDRTNWYNLPRIWIKLPGDNAEQAHVSTEYAAAYLDMHPKAFLRLAKQYAVKPDATLGKSNLYRRATLDRLHALRKPAGRPVKADRPDEAP